MLNKINVGKNAESKYTICDLPDTSLPTQLSFSDDVATTVTKACFLRNNLYAAISAPIKTNDHGKNAHKNV